MASQWAFIPHQRVPSEAPYRRRTCEWWSYERKKPGRIKNRHNTASNACSYYGRQVYLQQRRMNQSLYDE